MRLVRERLLLAPRSRSCSRSSSASPPRGCSRTDCSGWSPLPSASPAATSAHRSSTTETTRSASSRGRSTDARPPRAARQRAEGVRRERVARATHAALLDRRASWSSSPTRSSTRRHATASSRRCRARFASHQALDRPARSLARRCRPAHGSARARRPGASSRCSRASSSTLATSTGHELEGDVRADRVVPRRRRAHPADRPRACDERDDTLRQRDDGRRSRPRAARIVPSCRSRTTGPGFRRASTRRSSAASTASRAARRRAAASGSRSRARSPA